MGSSYIQGVQEEEQGIIPRVIGLIFSEADARRNRSAFVIKCAFIEIYNEEIINLLETNPHKEKKEITISEEKGAIVLRNLQDEIVNTE